MQILFAATDASGLFLKDWAMTYLGGGLVVVILGSITGWMIWRSNRRALESIEEESRIARAKYEQINEELSRLKAEVSETQT